MRIPLEQLSSTPLIIQDYLKQKSELKPFYHLSYNAENFRKQSVDKSKNYKHRAILTTQLREQMQTLELSDLQKQNLALLENKNTLSVTTGHQLNLFTGPLYFVYKISQTIKTAIEFNKSQNEFCYVPIFWMASEDHDFEEINHCYINKTTIEWKTEQTGAVGRFHLDGIDQVLSQFLEVLKKTAYFEPIKKILENAYQKQLTLSEATRRIVHTLFKEQGILILDADDKNLKQLMIPYFKSELINHSLYNNTSETLSELQDLGYKIQVNPRKINLFYLTENQRNRIIEKEGMYKVLHTDLEFTEDEIIKELEHHPERFSPNAVARPLYQEVILPNVAYIGGNSEIAYWLELKHYFDENRVFFPILIPRNSMVFLTKNDYRKLEKLQLDEKDITLSLMEMEQKVVQNYSTLDLGMNDKIAQLSDIYQDLKERSKSTDKTLYQLLDAEMKKQLNSFKKIEKRLYKAEKKIWTDKLQQLYNLYESIYPEGVFQERKENLFQFYQYYGEDFLVNVYNTISYKQSSLNIEDI